MNQRTALLNLGALAASGLALVVPTAVGAAQKDKAALGEDPAIVITLAGDVGLNPTNQRVDPKGVTDGGFQTWDDTTAGMTGLIDGDLNFMNVETVVTDRNDLPPDLKGQGRPFNFRMHPNGLRHLASTGFNLLSLANNHSMDYGPEGLEETMRHAAAARSDGVLAAAGVGRDRDEAAAPHTVTVKGAPIAFSAIGIVTNNLERHRAGDGKPGQIAYRFDDDFAEVRRRLVAAPAAFRILSIHYGVEGQVRADAKQLAEWRGLAARQDGIDLIVGHHAHVARGVEMAGRSLIFYGLGNFLHHGTANMTTKGICRDYGLFARVHAVAEADGRLAIKAVQAIPVTDTHMKPRPMTGAAGAARVHALNYLASTLDDAESGARGLRFTPQADGSGLHCVAGAEAIPGRIGTLCRSWKPTPPVPETLRGAIAASCSK